MSETSEVMQKIEVEIPRSQLIILRRLHDNAPVKASIEQAIGTFTKSWESGVEISKTGIKEISSLLNVSGFNSEAALVDAIKKRFNLSDRSVVFDVDESLATLIRRSAHGRSETFNEYVNRFVHSMFRFGILDWNVKSIFFNDGQWTRLKKALGTVKSTGENVATAIEEWARLKAAPLTAPAVPHPTIDHAEKTPGETVSDKNIEQALVDDEKKKRDQKEQMPNIARLDKHSPEYQKKLKEAMDRNAPKPQESKPEPQEQPVHNPPSAESQADGSAEESPATGEEVNLGEVQVPVGEIPQF